MVEKRLNAKWSGIWMPFEYWTAGPFEYWKIDTILFSYVLVRYLNDWSGKWDIEYRPTNLILNHLKSKLQKLWYSNGRFSDPLCSNHLNTTPEIWTFNFSDTFCLVFKWSEHIIRQTIHLAYILDHKTDIICPVFRPPSKNWTCWDHLNTIIVQFSDG